VGHFVIKNEFPFSQQLTTLIDSIQWFAQELQQLERNSDVNVIIHVTRALDLSSKPSSPSPEPSSEKSSVKESVLPVHPSPQESPINDLEKGGLQMTTASASSLNEIRPGRPDIGKLIAEAVAPRRSTDDRIILGTCGPSSLISTIRENVFSENYNHGPSLTLYTEVSIRNDPRLEVTLTKTCS
jgi:hypothetical protein